MSKRMFENADEGKFWEVWLDGANVFTRHGKTGANGQTKLKAGDQSTLDKMVKDKLKEGYAQTGGEVAKGPELDKKELKRHLSNLKPLADDPAYLVLADWLQTKEHPWGELIVLQHGAATNPKKAASLQKQADKHLKENGPVILGEAANDPRSHFEWHHGFVRRAVIASAADIKVMTKAVKSFLDSPVSHMVETLVISPYVATFTTHQDWDDSSGDMVDPWKELDKIAKLIPDRITRVGFGGWPASMAHAYVYLPSFSKVSSTFPKITALELTGLHTEKLGKLSLPQLTDLAIRFAHGNDETLRAVATSKLPKLERLTIWLGGTEHGLVDEVYSPDEDDEDDEDNDRYPATFSASDLEGMGMDTPDCEVTADGLRALLDASFSPKLTHLSIGSPRWTAELFGALAQGKLIKSLKKLTIHGGSWSDDIIKPLVAAKKALSHLESLELHAQMEAATEKKLKALTNATVTKPEERENFHLRYTATME